ncbi:MAG: hypothetical protein ACE5IG_06895 [Dehalococcoidia bacterium]
MADALTLEKRGIPAAVIGTDRLVATTGKGMARAHGAPNYPFAIIEHPIESVRGEGELRAKAEVAAQQVAVILTGQL